MTGGLIPRVVGLVVLGALLTVLGAKVLFQAARRPFPRRLHHLLDVAIAPLLALFLIVVLERFRELSS